MDKNTLVISTESQDSEYHRYDETSSHSIVPRWEIIVIAVVSCICIGLAIALGVVISQNRSNSSNPPSLLNDAEINSILLDIPCKGQSTSRCQAVTFLHLNDLYELLNVAKLATIKKKLIIRNPNTITVLSGDLISPSALSTAPYGTNDKLNGRHMIDVCNSILDYACLGNHEFDVREAVLKERLSESKFTWLTANTYALGTTTPFNNIPLYAIQKVPNGPTIGIIGAQIDLNKGMPSAYVDIPSYEATQPLLLSLATKLKAEQGCDIVVLLTHFEKDKDLKLAVAGTSIDLILGGHEHENSYSKKERIDGKWIPVAKADLNANSVFIHDLFWDPISKTLDVRSNLIIAADIAASEADPDMSSTVAKWMTIGFDGFEKEGYSPSLVIADLPIRLDGRDATVRKMPGSMTTAITSAWLATATALVVPSLAAKVDVVVLNAGSVRIDDFIGPGPITQYTVIRCLPYFDNIQISEMAGSTIKKIADIGLSLHDKGGYLHFSSGLTCSQFESSRTLCTGTWSIGQHALSDTDTTRFIIGMPSFLYNGKEGGGLDFIGELSAADKKPVLLDSTDSSEVRRSFIRYLSTTYPVKTAEDRI